jgi:hypothetical protein
MQSEPLRESSIPENVFSISERIDVASYSIETLESYLASIELLLNKDPMQSGFTNKVEVYSLTSLQMFVVIPIINYRDNSSTSYTMLRYRAERLYERLNGIITEALRKSNRGKIEEVL